MKDTKYDNKQYFSGGDSLQGSNYPDVDVRVLQPQTQSSPDVNRKDTKMKSMVKTMSKKNAELLLRALRGYSQSYYVYKDGKDFAYGNLTGSECDDLGDLTKLLADRIGLDSEAGY